MKLASKKNKTHVFTSAALNYIPKVKILLESIKEYHPDWIFHILVVDKKPAFPNLENYGFDSIVFAEDLNIPSWESWSFCHEIVELATAVKPFMLTYLLMMADCKNAIYFDPDIVLFSELDELEDYLAEANILLTPHQTIPEETLDAIMDNEICSLKHGIYNLGFVAVSSTAEGLRFSNWWSRRTYYFCRDDIKNGLFTDQRWIDLVPAFFNGVKILKSARFNVAPWNLTTRIISMSDSGKYIVNNEDLGFYHFTGFDSGDHEIMAAKNSLNNPIVMRLVDWYSKRTDVATSDPISLSVWGYGLYGDGTKIKRVDRQIYRERKDLQKAFPEPYVSQGYQNWLSTQGVIEYPKAYSDPSFANYFSLTPGFFLEDDSLGSKNFKENFKSGLKNPRTFWKKIKRKLVQKIKFINDDSSY